ncbi:adenosylcobinamide-GDP ribazoletransferase [Inquilinus sp. CA228]|uniref:adenosylcobinamide-GDP ribazoletransferase n=1 Tax=Inquilinus sp. CA228 TaxID=3455609 RepID=UPI003F8D153F
MDDLLRDLRVAACFLTRLPVRWPADAPADALARSMRLFPLAGAGIGAAAGLVWALALWLGAWVLAGLARRRIGGQTGDVLGAAQQLAEVAVLCAAGAA